MQSAIHYWSDYRRRKNLHFARVYHKSGETSTTYELYDIEESGGSQKDEEYRMRAQFALANSRAILRSKAQANAER
jgi:hypothetical protein